MKSSGKRIIVFQVSGYIQLQSPLIIENDDLTIAGQTAPGDGICIRDYPLIIRANNIIIRYIRSRLGDIHQLAEDAISATHCKNIIVDHCSFSWGIDEVASFYDNENTTVQWCIVSESLHHSFHHKGDHGYGGIWGGMGASFHHNLIADNASRNPRFMGSRYHKQPERELVDFRNNVIYNWGFNSSYGGEAGRQNLVANYYKYGPASKHKNRIVEPWDEDGRWFIDQNVVFGFPLITANNWAGGVQGEYVEDVRSDTVFNVSKVVTYSADTAFELVLADAGLVIPARDAVDTRLVYEVRSGTAAYGGNSGARSGIIDSQVSVGGWPALNSTEAPKDSDMDGMPDRWELENNLDPADPEDRNGDMIGDGYTNLEYYLNSLTIRDNFVLPPAEIHAKTVSSSEIRLQWLDNSVNESGFLLERKTNSAAADIFLIEIPENTTSWLDNGLSAGTEYLYSIKAFRGEVFSISDGEIIVKTTNEIPGVK